ncbi:DUF1499 domain-containing protein [Halioxenophilus aromaticivorans]|uniref:DUF1499 domain-containing protein n=1 Tax=Halioxenophilus aromaticivorans TaxID=1306992 RepID=A0AAV3UA77_9ALTE
MVERILVAGGLVLLALILIAVIALALQGVKSRAGKPPGLVAGQLQACSSRPNCQVTDHVRDTAHYTDPIILSESQTESAMDQVVLTIESMGGFVAARNDAYLAAEFKSSLFGFVDDFEVRLDSDKRVLHLRSASRVGYSDMGVNAKRIEAFRKAFSS